MERSRTADYHSSVTSVDSSGVASGFYASGPPNSKTASQNPASYDVFNGLISADGLEFILFGEWKYHFKVVPGGLMTGETKVQRTNRFDSTITLKRVAP
jgi:hypothetical protein